MAKHFEASLRGVPRLPRGLPRLALAAAMVTWLVGSSVAAAHAPLARALAIGPDGQGLALRMPGFGFVVRPAPSADFVYACDALLGIDPLATETPFAYGADGSLRVGTQHGLRLLDAQGCPVAHAAQSSALGELAQLPVALLAAHPADAAVLYAVSGGDAPALFASDDGGQSFERRAQLEAGLSPTSLVLDPERPARLYLGLTGVDGETSLASSADGGASFDYVPQAGQRVVLAVEPSGTLWARARETSSRMVLIERAEGAEGPWTEATRINFFGGFALDARRTPSVIWVGDEGSSVFRSDDGGASFVDVQPMLATTCLERRGDTLWACTPGTTLQPALGRLPEQGAGLEPVLALAEVSALPSCAPELDVASVCAAAFQEWRVDVRLEPTVIDKPMPAGTGAGGGAGGGGAGGASAGAAGGTSGEGSAQADAGAGPSPPAEPPRQRASGCQLAASLGASGCPPLACFAVLLLGLAWLARRGELPSRRLRQLRPQLARTAGIAATAACTRLDAMPSARSHAPSSAPHPGPSDDELMPLAQAGDVDAFAGLYDRHAPSVLALLARMLSSASEAEDVLHDVFLEAWQAVREFDRRRASVRTWLLVRARSRALDRIKRRAREPKPYEGLAPVGVMLPALARGTDVEQRLSLQRALEGLDASVRQVLELSYYEGMTGGEIAERTGVPEGTVRSRLSRGLEALASALGEPDRNES